MQKRPLLPKHIVDVLGGVAFLAFALWIVTAVAGDDTRNRLSAAGSAVAAIASAAALFTAALVLRGLILQRDAIAEDHKHQQNARVREMYADYFGQSQSILYALRYDLLANTVEDMQHVFDRTRQDTDALTILQWRVRLMDPNRDRTLMWASVEAGLIQLRWQIHTAVTQRIKDGTGLTEQEQSYFNMHVTGQLGFLQSTGDQLLKSLESDLGIPTGDPAFDFRPPSPDDPEALFAIRETPPD